jgi:hypothetical protein
MQKELIPITIRKISDNSLTGEFTVSSRQGPGRYALKVFINDSVKSLRDALFVSKQR